MRFTNFVSGCFGKIMGGILCIMLGVVLAFGGTVLAGYIVLTKPGMVGKVADLAEGKIEIELDEDTRGLSLLAWGKELTPIFQEFATTPIGELESALGISLLSNALNEITGLDIQVIKDTSLSDLGKAFAENLTVEQASENFGIEFPNLPVFNDPVFLASPLATAFQSMETFKLENFIEINENSSPILQSLADMQIGQMSDENNGLDQRINDLKLSEVITIVEEEGPTQSNKILIKLKDTKVGELGSPATNDLIMTMELQEVIDLEEGVSPDVLWRIRDVEIGKLGTSETEDKIKNMPLSELMDIDTNSSPILRYFQDNETTLNGIDDALKVMTLSDMITITDPETLGGGSTKLMWALRDCPLETIPADEENPEILGIEDQIKIVPLNELLEAGTTHIWTYLGTATIEDLGAKIDEMNMSDVIEIKADSPAILRKMRAFNPLVDDVDDEHKFGTEEIKVSELNTKLEPLIQSMELGELITIDSSSEPILLSLANTTVGGLNDKIATLQIDEVFTSDVYNSGVLSLVDSDTLITDIASELTTTVSTARVQRLIKADVMVEPTIDNDEINAGMRNRTINEIIADYSTILNNPLGGTSIIPERHYLTSSDTAINTAFLESLTGFDEGETLVLGANTTIAAEDFTYIFNVMTNGYTLTIESGATIRSATYDALEEEYLDKGGFMFISNNSDSISGVSGGGTINGSFDNPIGIKENDEITIKEII